MAEEQDQAIVRRALAGDRRAFEMLVRRHQDRVFSLVRGIVRHPEDAADVTQETFIAVLRHLDTFRQDSSFTTWLHRIAVRKAYDHLRRRTPEPLDPDSLVMQQLDERTDSQAAGLARSDLLGAIAALDDGFREAVLLVDVLGHSVEEAAATLDVAPGTIKSRVFRGRAALARHLGTLGYDGASKE
jgi:RNA polymerase sigma-70 factor, ECF subfamily